MTVKAREHDFPLATALLMPLCGPVILLPWAGTGLGPGFRIMLAAGVVFPAACILGLSAEWMYIFMALAGFNLACTALYLKMHPLRRPHSRVQEGLPWLRNLFGLLFLSCLTALMYAGVERWITDRLWSGFHEVNFSVGSILGDYREVCLQFMLLAVVTSAIAARRRIPWHIEQAGVLMAMLSVVSLAVNELHYFLIMIPRRHAVIADLFPAWTGTATDQAFHYLCLTGISLLVSQAAGRMLTFRPWKGFLLRGTCSLGLAVVMLGVLTGMPVYYSFLAARQYEKYGYTQKALNWYSATLHHAQSRQLKSYLQFHVGLLHRKNGNLEGLQKAVTQVLLKYNADPGIVETAQWFKNRLEAGSLSRDARVVIPGVEARTEYKAAYCVPNSLGLILNYWGDRIGARKIGAAITKLDAGSFFTDAAYYAESRNFRFYSLPMMVREDIFRFIDNGIPVLAFIPGHVVAIFGYDRLLETYITYDVGTLEVWDERTWGSFEPEWNKTFCLLAAVVPEAKAEEVARLLENTTEETGEDYMQYVFASLAEGPEHTGLEHLRRASGSGFFLADWEYFFHTGIQPAAPPSDSMVEPFLRRNGVEERTIQLYLYNLYSTGRYETAIRFAESLGEDDGLSPELSQILAGCQAALGREEQAVEALLSINDIKNLAPYSLEYLLRQTSVLARPHLALLVSKNILEAKPHSLLNGASAKMAYGVWRNYSRFETKNIRESLDYTWQYLRDWNPMDRAAVEDLEALFSRMKFRENDELNRDEWKNRIEGLKANLADSADVY